MTKLYLARTELREAWAAVPFDERRVARAIAVLVCLMEGAAESMVQSRPELAVDNASQA